MKARETLSATARAERAREATKQAIARELLYAGILARIWPSYIAKVNPKRPNPDFPFVLCIDSPAGWIAYRLSVDESDLFQWLGEARENHGEFASDRMATLLALATDGSWTR